MAALITVGYNLFIPARKETVIRIITNGTWQFLEHIPSRRCNGVRCGSDANFSRAQFHLTAVFKKKFLGIVDPLNACEKQTATVVSAIGH